jgi:hypothetical protein
MERQDRPILMTGDPSAVITFRANQQLTGLVRRFGIADGAGPRRDRQGSGTRFDLVAKVVDDFEFDIDNHPGRIKSIKLY